MKFIRKNGRVIPIDPERVNKVYNKAGREALVNKAKSIVTIGETKKKYEKLSAISDSKFLKIRSLKIKNDLAVKKMNSIKSHVALGVVGAGALYYFMNRNKK